MKVVYPTCCGVDVHKSFLIAIKKQKEKAIKQAKKLLQKEGKVTHFVKTVF